MTLRLLVFLADLDAGGAQRTILNLVRHLPAAGIAPVLALGRTDGAAAAWLDRSVERIDLCASSLTRSFIPLAATMRRLQPDAVMSTMLDANIVATLAWAASGRKPALLLRETNSIRARRDIGRMRRGLATRAYRSAHLVIALSEGVRRELATDMQLAVERTVTIPNPVEVEAVASAARNAAAAPTPWPGSGPLVIAIGRLVDQKGFDLLLEAFASGAPPDARLAILGEGQLRGTLEARLPALNLAGRVRMPGYVADTSAWLAHADLFVLSSRWEGFGHVIIEAMASGVPVLATRCPHGPEDIIKDGATGVLVATEDVAALGTGLHRMLADRALRRALAAAGRQAATRYEAARIAARYAEETRTAIATRISNMVR